MRVLRAVARGIDLVAHGVSFHLPLHRFVSRLLMAAVPCMTGPVEGALPAEFRGAGFIAALLEDPLAICVAVAQVP